MPAERYTPEIVIEFTDGVVADAVADAFASDLQSRTVALWADEVMAAISEAPKLDAASSPGTAPDRSQEKSLLAAQIADLQRRLAELEGGQQ